MTFPSCSVTAEYDAGFHMIPLTVYHQIGEGLMKTQHLFRGTEKIIAGVLSLNLMHRPSLYSFWFQNAKENLALKSLISLTPV